MPGFLTRPIGRRQIGGLVLALLLGGGSARPAAAASAESYVQAIAKDVMDLANTGQQGTALRGRFAALMNRYINLRAIADYALGPYRSKLPAGRQNEFYKLVTNYSAALFVFYVEDFRGTGLEITGTAKQGKFTIINSAIKLKGGGSEQVRWRLVPVGGGFRINDVNLKGVWLTISMKDRFTKVLSRSKGDFEPLFEELRAAETW